MTHKASAQALQARPEGKLLASCASVCVDSERAERIRDLIRKGIDWGYLIQMAELHSMLPLVYWHLNIICPQAVPGATFKQLQDHFHLNLQRNLVLTQEVLALMDMFEAERIAALFYTGPVLAASVYGNLGLRQSGGLDLLVPQRDVPKAKEVLVSRGYQPFFAMTRAQESVYLRTRCDYSFARADREIYVDLHWGIAPIYFSLPCDVERLWERLERRALEDRSVYILSPENLLLVLCIQGASCLWKRTDWLCDIAILIGAHKRMDWTWVMKRAGELGSTRMLLLGLFLASDLLGAALLEQVAQRVQNDSSVKALARQVSLGPLMGIDNTPGIFGSLLFDLRARERWRDRVRHFLSRALSPSPGDFMFITLPASLSFLYYFVRTIRLGKEYGLVLLKRLFRSPTTPVRFAPSLMVVVDRMLELAEVGPTDVVYDLGCGDGRIVVMAAKRYRARGIGFDLDQKRIAESQANARKEGVEHLVTFVQQDATTVDVSPATVVTLVMSPSWNLSMLPKLRQQLRPGTRLVIHGSHLGAWTPLKTELIADAESGPLIIHLWRIPEPPNRLPRG
jgi:SAM-dependent methyltransferase